MRFKLGQKVIDKIRGKKCKNGIKYLTKSSFSQTGEDLIVDFILKNIFQKQNIKYLDIGAHHSTWLSNTRMFYNNGSNGVLIEPDPLLFQEIKQNRPKDICLNCGIGFENQGNADFYIMDVPTLNTFDKETAYYNQNNNHHRIEKIIKIPLVKINDIFKLYFDAGCDFCSLDVEGLELKILKSIDFETYRPLVFCIETIMYDEDVTKQRKEDEIIEYLQKQDYFIYADSYINTIFVDKKSWYELSKNKID